MAGQGNANPPGGFFNHFIVQYSNQWYDPSYGNPSQGSLFLTQAEWENASIEGYRKQCDALPGDVRKQNDPTAVEMIFMAP
jgi:hypothetical protein